MREPSVQSWPWRTATRRFLFTTAGELMQEKLLGSTSSGGWGVSLRRFKSIRGAYKYFAETAASRAKHTKRPPKRKRLPFAMPHSFMALI